MEVAENLIVYNRSRSWQVVEASATRETILLLMSGSRTEWATVINIYQEMEMTFGLMQAEAG